jgi:hypothetical protein
MLKKIARATSVIKNEPALELIQKPFLTSAPKLTQEKD